MLRRFNFIIFIFITMMFFGLNQAVYADLQQEQNAQLTEHVQKIEQNAQMPQSDSQTSEQMNLIQNDVKVNDLDIEPINTRKLKNEVVPDVHQEGKKVIGLFLKTMIAVIISAILLYFILIATKKFQANSYLANENEEFEALDLVSPNNRDDALKSFINRTKL